MEPGAIGTHVEELMEGLEVAISNGNAFKVTAYAVDPDKYDTAVAVGNERRCVEAVIRKTWDHCVALGMFSGTCGVAWHPNTGEPQVFAVQPHTEDKFSPAEEARSLIGALISDRRDPGESQLFEEFFLEIIDHGDVAPAERQTSERLTLLTGGLLNELCDAIVCVALIAGTPPNEVFQRFALVNRPVLARLLAPDVTQLEVEMARGHVTSMLLPTSGTKEL